MNEQEKEKSIIGRIADDATVIAEAAADATNGLIHAGRKLATDKVIPKAVELAKKRGTEDEGRLEKGAKEAGNVVDIAADVASVIVTGGAKIMTDGIIPTMEKGAEKVKDIVTGQD